MSLTGFAEALWRNARRPAVASRCALIALAVGTILSLVNQWDVFFGSKAGPIPWVRILANYLIPLVVSNLGAMASPVTSGRDAR
jgi:hypothetical protein